MHYGVLIQGKYWSVRGTLYFEFEALIHPFYAFQERKRQAFLYGSQQHMMGPHHCIQIQNALAEIPV